MKLSCYIPADKEESYSGAIYCLDGVSFWIPEEEIEEAAADDGWPRAILILKGLPRKDFKRQVEQMKTSREEMNAYVEARKNGMPPYKEVQ